MPRKRDPQIEIRILDAAHQLWMKGGEDRLTMRAVARAAKTTTPTVYGRFRDRRDILQSLRERARMDQLRTIQPAQTALEACFQFLKFADAHPNEYRLLTADWSERLARNAPKPAFELIKQLLAKELGGTPEQHTVLALTLAELLHGAARMLIVDGVPESVSQRLRHACRTGCEALITHAKKAAQSNGKP